MTERLSRRRLQIARGDTEHPEAMRQRFVRTWQQQGFDVSGFVSTPDVLQVEPLAGNPFVDVVIPFCVSDAKYVAECVQSTLAQEHVTVAIHLVADGCEFPSELPDDDRIRRYATPGEWGPYRIANEVSRICQSEHLAIQDADDLMRPERLWRQLAILSSTGAEMVSSAAKNFVTPEQADNRELQRRVRQEVAVTPGKTFPSNPLGRCANTTRMMTLSLFRRMNGFRSLRCTADFEFDNRCRFTGVHIIDDQHIASDRRVHDSSLTNGSFRMGTPKRTADMQEVMKTIELMKQSPTLETARLRGSLNEERSGLCSL